MNNHDDDDLDAYDFDVVSYPRANSGGQHAGNNVGVIIVHKPSMIAVACNNERSQLRCKEKALARLRAILDALAWPQIDDDLKAPEQA